MIEILEVVDVPGFVAYPYLDDPFDDIDNQDKYLLHNYNNLPDAGFSFIFNGVINYYSQFCKHMLFIHGSVDMNVQLFRSYNHQLFISMFNLINKYKQSQSLITQGFNYHDFFYLTFKYHLESFPSFYKHIRWKIESMVCRFEWTLEFLQKHICNLVLILGTIKGTLQSIKCCISELSSCIRSFIDDLAKKIGCYIESLTFEYVICIRGSEVTGMNTLSVSLEQCKNELISSLSSKAKCLNLFQSNTEWLNNIICELKRIRCSACKDKNEVCDIGESLKSSDSIKSEVDTFKSCLNKYIERLTDITSRIKEIIGKGCLNDLNTIICEMCKFVCFAQCKIENFKSSVMLVIRFSCPGKTCNIRRVGVGIKCVMPNFCKVKKSLETIICSLKYQKYRAYDIISRVEGPWFNVKSRIEIMKSIRREMSEMESSINMVNFFKCSNKSITNNKKESTKRMLTTGNLASINEPTKSIPHTLNILGSENDKYVNAWTVLSNMGIIESKFVVSRLYEYYIKRKKILMTLQYANNCRCVYVYKLKHKDDHPYQTMTPEFIDSKKHLSFHMKELRTEGNHLCLCLVIIYHLYPNLIRCFCYFRDLEFDIISTKSRKFHKYAHSSINEIEISKMILFVIDLYKPISDWIEFRNPDPSKLSGGYTCFCSKYEDLYYKYFISAIIYISFLVENMFDHQNETTGDSIQSLSILVNELSSIGHTTQDKCPTSQQTEESKSASSQTPNNIMLVELYKRLVSIFGQNIYLLKSGGVYFLLGLKLLVDQLSNVGSILNPMIPSNSNYWIVSYLKSVEQTIMISRKNRGLASFYQFFSMLSFTLINSKSLCGKTKKHVKNVTILVSSEYISIITKGGEKKKDNECFFEKPADRDIVASCISLIYYFYNDLSLQLSNKVVLDFMIYSEECNKKDEIGYYLTRRTISYPESMSKNSRTNRIVESTNEITKKGFEGSSDSHYTYNDAYRINTSRAHGSLKYIIIKIVLILIIVVMTIFIRVKIETDDDYKTSDELDIDEDNSVSICVSIV